MSYIIGKFINIKTTGIIAGFFLVSAGFFLALLQKVDLSPVTFLLLAISGLGVLMLWLIIILYYIKNEAVTVLKSNEMAQKNSNDEKQEAQYKEGLGLRIRETEFNHAKEILKLLIELRKEQSMDSEKPTADDVKKLKEYFENYKTLLNQIKEIVKTN